MLLAIPRIWREPSDHHTDCYFCMVDPTKRRKRKNALPIQYPDILSSIAPVSHNITDLPVPQPLSRDQSCPAKASSGIPKRKVRHYQHLLCVVHADWGIKDVPITLIKKTSITSFERWRLTKSNAELLIPRLKIWDLRDERVRITSQRKRHRGFSAFFSFRDGLCYCHDIRDSSKL